MGYTGAAWATLICYATMLILSFLKGQEVYPIPYETGKLLLMMGIATVLWQAMEFAKMTFPLHTYTWWIISGITLTVYFGGMWRYLGGKDQLPLLRKE